MPHRSLFLADGCGRPAGHKRYRLVVDCFEVWSGELAGMPRRPWGPHRCCCPSALPARAPARVLFSALHARRLAENGVNGEVKVLEGVYAGAFERHDPLSAEPVVISPAATCQESECRRSARPGSGARRSPELREKSSATAPSARVCPARSRSRVLTTCSRSMAPFPAERMALALSRALCLVLPCRREGYGLIVVEAAALGAPGFVVAGPDGAAAEPGRRRGRRLCLAIRPRPRT